MNSQDVQSIFKTLTQVAKQPNQPAIDNLETLLSSLNEWEMKPEGLMPWSSNYTFLVNFNQPEVDDTPDEEPEDEEARELLGVYKPCAGERPLWDFPNGKLCHREFASYLLSRVLGWPNIPPTVLRDGPHGWGSVQLWVDAEYEAHYFNMRDSAIFTDEFREIAVFDYVVNNADRKGGHCLKGKDGVLWAIDHGLTFHSDFKLRTVIWEFCQEPIPDHLMNDLERLQSLFQDPTSGLTEAMAQLITPQEVTTLGQRIDSLTNHGRFPDLHPGRNVPYPPI